MDDEDRLLMIEDPLLPEAIRVHAARFKKPVRFVLPVDGDFVLFAEDGELMDIVSLKG